MIQIKYDDANQIWRRISEYTPWYPTELVRTKDTGRKRSEKGLPGSAAISPGVHAPRDRVLTEIIRYNIVMPAKCSCERPEKVDTPGPHHSGGISREDRTDLMAKLSTISGGTPGKPGERGIAPQPPQPPQPPRIPKIPKIPKASSPVERKKTDASRRQAR